MPNSVNLVQTNTIEPVFRVAPPKSLKEAAIERIRLFGRQYAYDVAPRSPHPLLSGNRNPGVSRLNWLKQKNKCNQFVGDVLTDAGFKMPTYTMPNGSKHYVNAEALLKYPRELKVLSVRQAPRPGDILLIDYLDKKGENGAHVEIVIDVKNTSLQLHTAGSASSGGLH